MVCFSESRWNDVREMYDSWWRRKRQSPLIGLRFAGKNPDRLPPQFPLLSQQTVHDLSISPEEIVDAIDYHLSGFEYHGAAFPSFNMDCFGPGLAAALLGARLDNSTGNVWFFCDNPKDSKDLSFSYQRNNLWMRRICDIYKAANDRFKGRVLMGLPDLGGTLDILHIFRPGETLLFDLYDSPEEIQRLTKELDAVLYQMWKDFSSACLCSQYGYHDWPNLYSAQPYTVVQSDFTYMISEEMFKEFAEGSVRSLSKKIAHTLYHLDGPGCLKHLPCLLKIKELDAIQWIPGDGNPTIDHYPQVYEDIINANKLVQLPNQGMAAVGNVISQTNEPGRFHVMTMDFPIERKDEVLEWARWLGMDVGG